MSARPRVLGAAISGCGLLLAVLPALPWYSATLTTGSTSLSGYGAGGASWILPVIGVALIVTGVLAAWWSPPTGTRTARVLGGCAILWAVLGVGWTALVALTPRVEVVAERAGLPDSPIAGDWDVTVLPPAWACLAAAAMAGMAGILLMTAPSGGGESDAP
jgi:MFS family permease